MDFQNLISRVWEQLYLFFQSYFAAWVLFTLMEFAYPNKKQPLFSKHQYHELLSGLMVAIVLWPLASLLKLQIFLGLGSLFPNLTVNLNWPIYIQVIFGLILFDLVQYIGHRMMHLKIFWPFHLFHHSAIELRSSTHFRVHPVDFIVARVFSILLLFLIGFDSEALRWVLISSTINNMWVHTNVNFDYGFPLRYILSSPNYHKWHHSAQIEGKDKNFADLFPFLDLLGGTYYQPDKKIPKSFGAFGFSEDSPVHQSLIGPLVYPFKAKKNPGEPPPGQNSKHNQSTNLNL
ncbi:MAG: sterol desaturase family protein [Reichenbachiella sp.]|uniref:sterol desaturase family protein n=2 Tax=Reichenbachiella sp. TaxID=2184521 RepID=UPI003265DDA8